MIGVQFDDVLRRAKEGDNDALGQLYADCSPRVLGYLRTQGIADHEDVAAEVFVSMVRDLQRFNGDEDAFRGWIFTIAQRRLVDERRRRGRRPEDPVEFDAMSDALGSVPTAEREALERLRATGLLEMIEALTPDQRSVLYLRAVGDLTVPDIARTLGKPETAVKALLRRAAATLARRMEQEVGE
ncbi:MAG TPA: RNA polymerase sigma factor [Acidimicrobiales bacterium]